MARPRAQSRADVAADLTVCRAFVRERSPKLGWGALALPPRVRDPWLVVLSFALALEDMVSAGQIAGATAADLRDRVRAAASGAPKASPIDRAYARVAQAHALPEAIPESMLEGLTWVAEGRRYGTYEGLIDYCVRVRGSVAIALLLIMGRRKREVVERAVDLGVAAALVTIARDVTTDARAGRLYLPVEWLEEERVDADDLLASGPSSGSLEPVVRRVLEAADSFLSRSDPGLAALPFDCRPAIRGLRYSLAALSHEIQADVGGALRENVDLPTTRVVRLLSRALRASRAESRPLLSQPLREAQRLVDEVCRA
ncbi:MAG: squalene/phytoene synthase family protein [Polyangiaceae bacterium]|nr:squalene/phytoene synthase family protein [Polyangiaceae bacterium]MBK8938879.1 squalene/phytoene synthase family protein [Polyangiaceae bacterium]